MVQAVGDKLTSGKEKVAALLLSVSDENQKSLFSRFKEREIWGISSSMSSLGAVKPQVLKTVFMDFLRLMREGSAVVGSADGTKKMLENLLGKDKASSVLDGVVGDEEGVWEQLSEVNADMLAQFLKKEDPQTISVILSRIAPHRSAHVLSLYREELSVDILLKILKAVPVKGSVLDEIQRFLKTEFMEEFKRGATALDPHKVVAEILNSLDQTAGDKILGVLEKKAPDSAARVRALMFTFEDLLRIDQRGMMVVIGAVDKGQLALSLKSASQNLKDIFFKSMSERAAKLLKDDIEALGSVRLSEVEKAQRAIIATVRQLQKAGDITVPDASEDKAMVS